MADGAVSQKEFLYVAGQLLHNSAATDHFMFMAFKVLANIADVRIAKAIFYNLDSFPARRNLIKRVMEINPDPETDKLLDEIMNAAQKSLNQRRQVAHGIIVHETPQDDSPFKLMLPKSMKSEAVAVTQDSLDTLLGHSRDAFHAGASAFQRLCERHKVPPTLEF